MPSDTTYYQRIAGLIRGTSAGLPPARHGTGKQWGKRIRRLLPRAIVLLALALALLYAADTVRFRAITAQPNAFGTVNVDTYSAIHKKGGKTEFSYAGADSVPCVHAIFPHGGRTPCWYLERHTTREIDF